MTAQIEFPHPGIQTWTNPHGIKIFRLHYSADPRKTKEWASKQESAMTDKGMYRQEYEIDFGARIGTLIYQLHEEATFEEDFVIPKDWTRYYALDPHPVVPHASLWIAIDRWGDPWVYRELWPSRACGRPGNVPEDDDRFTIKEYVEAVKWLESSANPENGGADEDIFQRVIDYSARTFGQGLSDENPDLNFQQRFEDLGGWRFSDCIKDHEAGAEAVNEWLKPRDVEQPDGTFKPKSRLHIFASRCPELVWELKNNRFQQLTPLMAQRQDPTGKPVDKRKHMTDCLRYLAMARPEYIEKRRLTSTWKPAVEGIAY